MQLTTEASAWLLQAKDLLDEARRLKPGPERNELRQTAKVLREIAKLEAASGSHSNVIGGREPDRAEGPLTNGAFPERRSGKSRRGRLGGRAETRSDGIARFNSRDAPIFGQSRRARSGRIHRENLLGFETHDPVAFARRRREPRPIDLDQASSIGPDRSARAQIAHQERHRRASHTEYLRQRLLGEREHIMVDPVAKLEQPASHAGFDRMQRIAGGTELELYQHRPDVTLERTPDRGTPVKCGVKSRCRDPGGGAG